jgi:CDP-glycerol glycerophosphotransferase (TagB/SpsB family)
VEKPILERLTDRYKNNLNIEWDYNHENIYSLAKADVMISDFSGIIYDYVFLFDKPVLINTQNMDLRHLDAHNLKQEPSYLQYLKKIGVELNKSNFDSIKGLILDILQNSELKKIRREVKREMWQYQGESGKRIVDFLTKVVNKEYC